MHTTDYLIAGIAGLAVLGAIVLVIVTGVVRANPPVAAMVRGFDVISPTKVTAELVIQRKDPATPVECEIYAQATSYEKVAEQRTSRRGSGCHHSARGGLRCGGC